MKQRGAFDIFLGCSPCGHLSGSLSQPQSKLHHRRSNGRPFLHSSQSHTQGQEFLKKSRKLIKGWNPYEVYKLTAIDSDVTILQQRNFRKRKIMPKNFLLLRQTIIATPLEADTSVFINVAFMKEILMTFQLLLYAWTLLCSSSMPFRLAANKGCSRCQRHLLQSRESHLDCWLTCKIL